MRLNIQLLGLLGSLAVSTGAFASCNEQTALQISKGAVTQIRRLVNPNEQMRVSASLGTSNANDTIIVHVGVSWSGVIGSDSYEVRLNRNNCFISRVEYTGSLE